MARSEPQINLRIPAELKDQLDQAAAENKRSLTAEVVARLEASFAASSWAATFPSSAAVARGAPSGVPDPTEIARWRLEEEAKAHRLRDLEVQRVNLSAQAYQLSRELDALAGQLVQAKQEKSPEVDRLKEQFFRLRDLTHELDKRIAELDEAIKQSKPSKK